MESPTIERAAHLFVCFYSHRATEICREEGMSPADVMRGSHIARERKEVDYILRGIYGDPSYGSWPAAAAAERTKMLAQRGVL